MALRALTGVLAYPTLTEARVLALPSGWVGWDLVFEPPSPFLEDGFPTERVRLVLRDEFVWPEVFARMLRELSVDQGKAPVDVYVYPLLPSDRVWAHRNPVRPDGDGSLCLWFPGDPPSLRWQPWDGLASLLLIVHRHLLAEEHARRTGSWPVEDAPHGLPDSGMPYPIRSALMRRAVQV